MSKTSEYNTIDVCACEESYTHVFLYVFRRHSENVHELFYLQSNGNMMDYPVWKKKSKTPQFLAFHKAHQLDAPKVPSTSSPLISAVSTTTPASAAAAAVAAPSSQNTLASGGSQTPQHRVPIGGTTATLTSGGGARMSSGAGQQRAGVSGAPVGQQQQLPHGAEIKISGVGVTPVAVSTKLPAAVVQLSQQGRLGCTRDTLFFSPIWFFLVYGLTNCPMMFAVFG